MRINSIQVNNYRSLKEVTVDLMKKINMFYGYNNTGKSNFLRFVELIFRRKMSSSSITYVDEGGQQVKQTEAPSDWWEGKFRDMPYMFTDDNTDVKITFVIKLELEHSELKELQEALAEEFSGQDHGIAHICIEGIIRSITYEESEILLTKVIFNQNIAYDSSAKNESNRYFPSSKTLLGNKKMLESLLSIFNDCVLFLGSERYLLDEQELPKVSGKLLPQNTKNWLFDAFMNAQKYPEFKKFIEFVKAYQSQHKRKDVAKWPFSTGDVGFGRFGKNIDLMLHNTKGRFPLSSYGTGVQQILYILAQLFFTNARIVLIEEIELNLSPAAQREIFKNLNRLLTTKYLDQIFFTTHSNFFNYRGDFQIYETLLNDDGYTNIRQNRDLKFSFFKRLIINEN